jgi:nitrate reductase assembly molybdenum cofactor insertion protein NarJ
MTTMTPTEHIDLHLHARARGCALASALVAYPDDELARIVAGLDASTLDEHGAGGLRAALRAAGGLDDLRGRHLDLFDRGGQRASLHETEYGRMRGMSKGRDLADIAGFYHAFGLRLDEERHEMLDHLGVELEFYAILLLKQEALLALGDAEGGEIVRDARRKFLAEHLGGLAGAVADRGEVRDDPIYGAVFVACARRIAEECAAVGVTAAPLDFFTDADLKEEMKCGAVHLPVVPS